MDLFENVILKKCKSDLELGRYILLKLYYWIICVEQEVIKISNNKLLHPYLGD